MELVGSMQMLIGLFTRPVALVLSGMMAVAHFQFHVPGGLWPLVNRGESAALYRWVFLDLAFVGQGTWTRR